jgi:hypothetical protein
MASGNHELPSSLPFAGNAGISGSSRLAAFGRNESIWHALAARPYASNITVNRDLRILASL